MLTVLSLFAAAPQAFGLEGRAEVRGNVREGMAQGDAYTTRILREDYQLGQLIGLSPGLHLQTDYLVRRENLKSSGAGLDAKTERISLLPSMSLSYRHDWIRAGLAGHGFRRDDFRDSGPTQRDDRLDYTLWSRAERGDTELDVRWQDTHAWRYLAADERHSRDRNFGLNLNQPLADRHRLRYRFSDTNHEDLALDAQNRFRTHTLRYDGSGEFAGDRGTVYLQTVSSHFRQTNRLGGPEGRELLIPIFGGYMIDDTPEILDPLEPAASRVASLHDTDRLQPTPVNIGDSAPVGREFGGDYRNLVYEFGDSETLVQAFIYVDIPLNFPELIRWEVYATEDPEGREFGSPLPAASYRATYREDPTGTQGWEFVFDVPVIARTIKFVDTKVGVTEDDIFITELEVFGRTEDQETKSTAVRHRLIADVGYEVSEDLSFRYNNDLNWQLFDDEARNRTGSNHIISSRLGLGSWELGGRAAWSRLSGETGDNIDARSQQVSLISDAARKERLRLTWSRTQDYSAGRDQTTQNWTADGNVELAPALVVNQKVGYGLRDFALEGFDASSWFLITTVRSAPRPSIRVNLMRADRWLEGGTGGSGFTRYNETEALVNWALLPLLRWSGMARYQVRGDRDDWLVRNNLTWSPLQGGRLGMSFFASDYQDTATELLQRSVGTTVTLAALNSLRFEGGVELQYLRQFGARSHPRNFHFKGNWTF